MGGQACEMRVNGGFRQTTTLSTELDRELGGRDRDAGGPCRATLAP